MVLASQCTTGHDPQPHPQGSKPQLNDQRSWFLLSPLPTSIPKPSNQCAHPNTADSPSFLKVEKSLKRKQVCRVNYSSFNGSKLFFYIKKVRLNFLHSSYISCILGTCLLYDRPFIFVCIPVLRDDCFWKCTIKDCFKSFSS